MELEPSQPLPERCGRRQILARGVSWALGGISEGLDAWIGDPIPSATTNSESWLDLGPVSDWLKIPDGRSNEVMAVISLAAHEIALPYVFVRCSPDGTIAQVLSPRCRHQGAMLRWIEGLGCFQCPTHGSTYGPQGERISGPAAIDLESVRWRMTADRHLQIRLSVPG